MAEAPAAVAVERAVVFCLKTRWLDVDVLIPSVSGVFVCPGLVGLQYKVNLGPWLLQQGGLSGVSEEKGGESFKGQLTCNS